MPMQFTPTALPEVVLIEPRVFGDERGFFLETFREDEMRANGLAGPWVQDNHSHSAKGVLRGIHYQIERAQGKLVRVTRGSVFDVAVDLRESSPHFGQWVGYELSAANHRMLWVPPGFGHAFLTLEDDTDFQYKCTEYYAPEHERCIVWNDTEIGIDWPDTGRPPDLSGKDAQGARLGEAEVY